MYKTIFIGGVQRSGGSLLARLFDGHPQIASYPVEVGFPFSDKFYKRFENHLGIPMTVPKRDDFNQESLFSLLGIPEEKPDVILKYGKEQGDKIGVRQNYLEKQYYGAVKTDFSFDQFKDLVVDYAKDAGSVAGYYDARHKAYFEAWDNGAHGKEAGYVVMHASAGLYLTNIEDFFQEFSGSVFMHSLRNPLGLIASEKSRLVKRYYGSRRFSYPPFPNNFIKSFNNYDLKALIRAWKVAVTRLVLLQEKYGCDQRFIVLSYDYLVKNVVESMQMLSKCVGIDYDDTLINPTIGGVDWHGNSHSGKQQGVNKGLLQSYNKWLRDDEIDLIKKETKALIELIESTKDVVLDLTQLDKKFFFDYDYQKKYFDDVEKITLYLTLMNTGTRRAMIAPPRFTAIAAYVYAFFVRILHVPRLLKLKIFPGKGKQNYT